MNAAIIAVDIGGTRIRAARLDSNLHIEVREEMPTLAHEGYDATLQRIVTCVRHVWPDDERHVKGVGISMPGPLNPKTGVVISPPNLNGWINVPLVDIMQEIFGVPAYIAKDTNAAILAETIRGVAHGLMNVVYITISTGLGGAVIIDGRLVLGAHGMATEIGHMMIIQEGQPVFLEYHTAGPAIARKAHERLKNGEHSAITDFVQGDLSQIKTRHVTRAAANGDALALDIVQQVGQLIGFGIVNLLHLFNPEIVVIGGGVSKAGNVLFDPIWKIVRAHSLNALYWEDLRIEVAAFGDDVGIVGAGILVVMDGDTTDIARLSQQIG